MYDYPQKGGGKGKEKKKGGRDNRKAGKAGLSLPFLEKETAGLSSEVTVTWCSVAGGLTIDARDILSSLFPSPHPVVRLSDSETRVIVGFSGGHDSVFGAFVPATEKTSPFPSIHSFFPFTRAVCAFLYRKQCEP